MTGFSNYNGILEELNINVGELGCVMLDCEPLNIPPLPSPFLYKSPNPDRWWVDGWVADKLHITLKYGLLKPAKEWERYISELIGDLEFDANGIGVSGIELFPSPYPDEKYDALVLTAYVSPYLDEVNRRLSYLPHIDTFTPYKPHATLAYLQPGVGEHIYDSVRNMAVGLTLTPTFINLGENRS